VFKTYKIILTYFKCFYAQCLFVKSITFEGLLSLPNLIKWSIRLHHLVTLVKSFSMPCESFRLNIIWVSNCTLNGWESLCKYYLKLYILLIFMMWHHFLIEIIEIFLKNTRSSNWNMFQPFKLYSKLEKINKQQIIWIFLQPMKLEFFSSNILFFWNFLKF
jgi:hypothetical protein